MHKLSEKQKQALDLSRNLAITAGAGSGKTSVLVNRYLHLLLSFSHLSVKNLLAITFTEKATAEMKDRIFNTIRQQFTQNRSQQGRLFEILNELHEAQIFTIHAFCGHILRQYPTESGLNADFTILRDIEIDGLLNRVFREFLISFDVKAHAQGQVIMRTFREFPTYRLLEMLKFFYYKRTQLFPFLETYAQKSSELIQADWQKIFIQYHLNCLSPLMKQPSFWNDLKELCNLAIASDSQGFKIQAQLKQLFDKYQNNDDDKNSQILLLIQIIDNLTKADKAAYSAVPGGKKSWGNDGVILFKKISGQAASFAPQLIPYEDSLEKTFSLIQKGLSLIILEVFRKIEAEKLRLNVLDFDDLQIHTLKLIQSFPEIHSHLRKQYKFILVDEYQDTDLLQDNLIHLLSHDQLGNLDQNKLFIVGDPKQSIFGFRNADVSLFQKFITEISSQENVQSRSKPTQIEDQKSKSILRLNQNYRSSPELIHFYNKTFKSIFRRESEFDVEYQSLEASRQDHPEQHSFVQLDIFLNEDQEKKDTVIEQAHIAAQNIKRIVNNQDYQKFYIDNDNTSYQTIGYGDIAVLIRSRTHLNRFEQIFRQYEIPYQTYKGMGFFQRQEIQDIYYFLRSITFLEDDFALITVLRSDFIGLSDLTLFYLSQFKGDNYWEKLNHLNIFLQEGNFRPEALNTQFAQYLQDQDQKMNIQEDEKNTIKTILSLYPGWHHLAVNGEYSKLLDEIIEKLNIRALLEFQIDNKQKLANLEKLIHTIFEYEYNSSIYSTELLEMLKKQISGELQEGEAIILTEEEKVKIITYHSAKGMEFPVVFLPMLETPFQYNKQFLWDHKYGFSFLLDRSGNKADKKSFSFKFLQLRDQQNIYAEEKRLYYVASTRAKDFLFLMGTIPVNNKLPQDSYLNWTLDAYELSEEKINAVDTLREFKDETGFILKIHKAGKEHPTDDHEAYTTTRRDGFNIITDQDIENIYPLREKPALQTYSVTQLMIFRENRERYLQHFYLNDGRLKLSTLEREFIDEPGGELWGSLIHKVLEDFYLRSPEDDYNKIKQLVQLFDYNNQDKQIEQKLSHVLTKIRNEKSMMNINPKEALSEFPIELRLEDFVLKGIFDLLFKNKDGIWEIIDYKTNKIKASETASLAKKYSFQMSTYALLLARMYPNQQIYPVSLLFIEPMKKEEYTFNLLEIEEARLDTLNLLTEIYQFEKSIFQPTSFSTNNKTPENKA